jgi:ABC-type lipoprotein release transport system permease subunit
MIVLLIFRNLVRSAKNNILILILIAIVTFLFFIGNSIIGNSNRGLKKNYVESITGDIVVQKKSDISMNLFGANAPVIDNYFSIPILSAHDTILELIRRQPEVENAASQVSGSAYMEILGTKEPALLCGVGDNYFNLFPGIELKAGRFIKRGEYGAMITEEKAAEIFLKKGIYPIIGDTILFTSGGDAGFKIRETPLTGIFSYKNKGRFLSSVILADPQTVRVLSSIQVASADVAVDENAASLLLSGGDVDDIFGTENFDTEIPANKNFSLQKNLAENLSTFLSQNKETESAKGEGGEWNFIIIKLKPRTNETYFINKLNKQLENYDAMAVGWRFAAGTSAIIVLLIQALFNAGILMVSAACIIAIVNILLIAVFERTREIGTLRAIGAKDAAISLLIYGENCTIGLVSGVLGLVTGAVFLILINRAGIVIHNDLLAQLLGAVLHIDFSWPLAFASVIVSFALSFFASIFPVRTAIKIEPVVAVGRS